MDDVERIVAESGIDAIVPAFEEVFYLSTQHVRLEGGRCSPLRSRPC